MTLLRTQIMFGTAVTICVGKLEHPEKIPTTDTITFSRVETGENSCQKRLFLHQESFLFL